MKFTNVLLLLLLGCFFSCNDKVPQKLDGRWYAKVEIDEEVFHYLLEIRRKNNAFVGYLDLPTDETFRIAIDSLIIEKEELFFVQEGLDIRFTGQVNKQNEALEETLSRDGVGYEVKFSRNPQVPRSQTIRHPIPYASEDVYFYNRDSTKLAGTITFPKESDSLTVVVLISGSGAQNRNEEILGHKPFLVLADHLSRQGIAVLRYDDRGCGESAGQFRPATSLDYSYDALAAVQFLKQQRKLPIRKIGLIGHSEGGNIAPVVATMDAAIDFLVLLAAPGTSNYESYLVSLDLILQAYPETYERDYPFFKSVYQDMSTIKDEEILKDSLSAKFQYIASQMDEEEFSVYNGKENYIDSQVAYHTSEWYHYYLQFDVTTYLQDLKIPVLALNGDKDVSVEADFNLNGIEHTLTQAGNENFAVVKLENVNHFFQVSEDDKIESVYFNEETFSKIALAKISDWIAIL